LFDFPLKLKKIDAAETLKVYRIFLVSFTICDTVKLQKPVVLVFKAESKFLCEFRNSTDKIWQ